MRPIDSQQQRLDSLVARLGRPSALATRHRMLLEMLAQRLRAGPVSQLRQRADALGRQQLEVTRLWREQLGRKRQALTQLEARLTLLDPKLVLRRGYAWVLDDAGRPLTHVAQSHVGQALQVMLVDGRLGVTVDSQST